MPNTPITFVHLTDLHISAPELSDKHLQMDTVAATRHSLSEIRRLAKPPSFIVISGDLTNRGDQASYEVLKRVLETEAPKVPILCALGNHDHRSSFRAVFEPDSEPNDMPLDYDRVLKGLHVIVLDSSLPGRVLGGWEAGQMDWLGTRLKKHPDLPKLICSHHRPRISDGDLAWSCLTIDASEQLRCAISGQNVAGILTGHVHMDCVHHWYGVPVISNAGHHAGTDPVAYPQMFNMTDAAGFAICTLHASGLSTNFVPHPQTRHVLHEVDPSLLEHVEGAD
ncbi:metallophosphoesterase family protein [Candidatus Rhodobacter oscarellae]|uniref:metallophosphoesterase family protein n=1 Tax=Candidatus Rhodobacter oscarellae TaxID=1675527 RepID=UPI0009E634C4|nr:metallophosphoesterase [Candidatus Rhodobacter lobularis]